MQQNKDLAWIKAAFINHVFFFFSFQDLFPIVILKKNLLENNILPPCQQKCDSYRWIFTESSHWAKSVLELWCLSILWYVCVWHLETPSYGGCGDLWSKNQFLILHFVFFLTRSLVTPAWGLIKLVTVKHDFFGGVIQYMLCLSMNKRPGVARAPLKTTLSIII